MREPLRLQLDPGRANAQVLRMRLRNTKLGRNGLVGKAGVSQG